MSRKKILWLCSWYPSKCDPFNGDFIQRHAIAASAFNDIYVIYLAADSEKRFKAKEKDIQKKDGLTEHIVYYPVSRTFIGRLKAQFNYIFNFKQAIRHYLVEKGKPDFVHVHVSMKAGLLALWLKKRYKIPFVVTEHYGIYNETIGNDSYINRSSLFKSYTQKIFQQSVGFASVSKFLGEGVNRMVIKKDYIIIPNAVDTKLFFCKTKSAEKFRFIHISNMVPLKNTEGIVRAFRSFLDAGVNATLCMIGNNDDKMPNYAAALNLGPDKVSFLGIVPHEKVAAEIQASDCLLLFSNIENSPCVIGEALCCGLPVIATNVGGIPELVNEANAILVEAANENELCRAMQKMVARYHVYNRNKIAENAISKFSYPVIGKKLDEFYNGILNP